MPHLCGSGNSGPRLRDLSSGDPRMHHVRSGPPGSSGPSGRPVRDLRSGDPRMHLVRGPHSRTGLPDLRQNRMHRL